jgi:hypothetical protein
MYMGRPPNTKTLFGTGVNGFDIMFNYIINKRKIFKTITRIILWIKYKYIIIHFLNGGGKLVWA